MEDLKGKIRVFCRMRPMLPFEKNKGQSVAVTVPDELTIAHPWKDEKKPREYVFDTIFTSDISQEKVSWIVNLYLRSLCLLLGV